MGVVLVIAIVWILLAVIVGLGIAQMIARRDRQVPKS